MINDNQFFRLSAQGLVRDDEDEFTQSCFELGAAGVAEDLKFVQKDLRYDPDVVETPELDLNIYFTEIPDESRLMSLESRYPQVRFTRHIEANKDWLLEWKKGFKPFRFAGPFWVIPAWLEPPAEAGDDRSRHIYVEPGMAFGTGTHETTRLAAGLVLDVVVGPTFRRLTPIQSVLDVGTGTGILALIAYRLGVQKLVGLDIDPEARRTARENLERNHATAIAILDHDLAEETGIYDLVVANIIDGVLATLRHELVRCLKPGGNLVVSGVLMDRESEFYDGFTGDTGLTLVGKVTEGEWSAAILQKRV